MSIRYTDGSCYAVAAERAVAILDATVAHSLAEAVWETLSAGGGVAGTIELLTEAHGRGFAALPRFAVVVGDDAGALVAVRGAIEVRLHRHDTVETISGAHVSTWREQWVADLGTADLIDAAGGASPGLGTEGAAALPLRSGVARAGALRLVLLEGEGSVPRPGHPDPPPSPEVAPVPSPTVETTLAPRDEVEDQVERIARPGDDVPRARAVAGASDRRPAVEPPAVELTVTDEVEGGYDHLWGSTVVRRVEDAAVRDEPEDDKQEQAVVGAASARLVPPAGPAFPPHETSAASPPLISAVPGLPDVFADDHDGETISRAQLSGIQAHAVGGVRDADADSVPAKSVSGPRVLARLCGDGHPNPPQAGACRACGGALIGDAVRVPRPELGRLRLSGGETVALEGPVLLGRSPRVSRVTGADVPRLVTVPSPTREISGTHLSIRLEEWHVLVADAGSSNGTIWRRPGEPPRRLHPHAEEIARSGDVADLGDEVTITFEGLP